MIKNLLLLIISLLIFSCSGSRSDEGEGVVTYIKLSSNQPSFLLGNSVKFTVTDNLGNDVTSKSTFSIDGSASTTTNVFSPNVTGTYTITAKMDGFQSKPLKVTATTANGVNFVHRMLFEDFTGSWCGNCPIASVRYENLIQQNNHVVFIGVHGPQGTQDPFINATSQALIDYRGIWGYPTISLNRKTEWSTNNFNYTDMSFPLQYIAPYSKVGISINSTTNNSTLNGEVKLSFGEAFSNLKVAIYIVENDLVYPQHNYFNGSGGKPILYGGVPIITNYSNHNVLRDKLTAIDGEAIPDAQSQGNALFTKTFQYSIPANFNKDNLKIVVLVLNNLGEVINTREANFNSENNLEVL